MAYKYIFHKKRRYYLYEKYSTWEEAQRQGKRYKRRDGGKYLIIKSEEGMFSPKIKYYLYLTKTIKLW